MVATGNSVSSLTVCDTCRNDDADFTPQSRIVLDVTAGTTYNIAVDGFRSRQGAIDLNIDFNA